MYTFWRRTTPYPTFVIFDAPDRSQCIVSRARTNTPLQALATMNDPQFVEAARVFWPADPAAGARQRRRPTEAGDAAGRVARAGRGGARSAAVAAGRRADALPSAAGSRSKPGPPPAPIRSRRALMWWSTLPGPPWPTRCSIWTRPSTANDNQFDSCKVIPWPTNTLDSSSLWPAASFSAAPPPDWAWWLPRRCCVPACCRLRPAAPAARCVRAAACWAAGTSPAPPSE